MKKYRVLSVLLAAVLAFSSCSEKTSSTATTETTALTTTTTSAKATVTTASETTTAETTTVTTTSETTTAETTTTTTTTTTEATTTPPPETKPIIVTTPDAATMSEIIGRYSSEEVTEMIANHIWNGGELDTDMMLGVTGFAIILKFSSLVDARLTVKYGDEATTLEFKGKKYKKVSDIDFLAYCPLLEYYSSCELVIDDYSPLYNLEHLTLVSITAGNVGDAAFAPNLKHLNVLSLTSSNLTSVKHLKEMSFLDTLDIRNNDKITDEDEEAIHENCPITNVWR